MKYENNKVRDLNIAYIGGGSRGWAWTFMTDLSMDDSLSGTIRLYDIDEAAAKNNEIIGNKLTAREDTTGKWDYVTCSTIGGHQRVRSGSMGHQLHQPHDLMCEDSVPCVPADQGIWMLP